MPSIVVMMCLPLVNQRINSNRYIERDLYLVEIKEANLALYF